jgi:hypothetical protein
MAIAFLLAFLVIMLTSSRRQNDSVFRSAAAGRYARVVTCIVVVLLVLAALDPESRLFLMVIDAIGFDLLVAFFALQFRSVWAAAWQTLRSGFANLRPRDIWALTLVPRANLHSLRMIGFACAWIFVGLSFL